MADTEGALKIGEAARRLGLAPSTLRFYEDQGLVAPQRTPKGTRLYDPQDVERLAVVQALGEVGVPLSTARDLVRARPDSETGNEASHKVHALLGELRGAVEAKMRECEALLAQIEAADALVRQCYGCDKPPTPNGCHACPTAHSLQQARMMRLVWERG